ncbi:MAG: lipoate--protein ligase [Bacteroidales bacterium]|nr:lipoate--protein ligase [Bacteroidales bacterium]
MIAILSPSYDPYFNVALEYYLLHFFDDEVLLLYRNETSVIVGKHQNAFAEANQNFLRQHQIPLIRRISGGGTVYHDLGNINITLIREGKLDFNVFLSPLIKSLALFNLNVEQNLKNDLLLGGKKITGTAAHVYKNKTLHHGTLLFDADQHLLHLALSGNKSLFEDNSVKSKPSPTTNIKQYLNDLKNAEAFTKEIYEQLKNSYKIKHDYSLLKNDIKNINDWIKYRFKTWDWNYGYSPAFEFVNTIFEKESEIKLKFFVKSGMIEKASISINNEIILLEFLHHSQFIQDNIIDKLLSWSKKNCPTLTLDSFEKLLDF